VSKLTSGPVSLVQQYFSYIVVVCYRDDGLSELLDTEIYKELEPHGIAHVKRFISRETGPEVHLDTFLIANNTPNIPISIRITPSTNNQKQKYITNYSTTVVDSSVREAEMLMPLISLRTTKFNDCCFLKHSMIKLPDLNFVTFFTSPAQPDCFFLW
jgi:hypothetical protein